MDGAQQMTQSYLLSTGPLLHLIPVRLLLPVCTLWLKVQKSRFNYNQVEFILVLNVEGGGERGIIFKKN